MLLANDIDILFVKLKRYSIRRRSNKITDYCLPFDSVGNVTILAMFLDFNILLFVPIFKKYLSYNSLFNSSILISRFADPVDFNMISTVHENFRTVTTTLHDRIVSPSPRICKVGVFPPMLISTVRCNHACSTGGAGQNFTSR